MYIHLLCYRCIWATHYEYMCYVIGVYGLHTMCTCAIYDIGVYGLHTMCIYTCYVIGVYGLHTMCTCAML